MKACTPGAVHNVPELPDDRSVFLDADRLEGVLLRRAIVGTRASFRSAMGRN